MVVKHKVKAKLALPTANNEPPENLHDYCAMIYGRKQWGKSTLASQYPNAINFQFEPGRKGLRIAQIESSLLTNWDRVMEYQQLVIDGEGDHDFVVIDTLDRAYDMCLRDTCLLESKGEFDHPQKFKEGYHLWEYIKRNFEAFFVGLLDAGKKFVLVSHDKQRIYKDRDGSEWTRIEPTCSPAAWKIAQSMCDFVFHGDFITGDRIVTVRDLDNSTLASCNPDLDCFLDPDGKEIRRFKLAGDKSKSFKSLLAAFNNEAHDFDWTPPSKFVKPKGTVAAKGIKLRNKA